MYNINSKNKQYEIIHNIKRLINFIEENNTLPLESIYNPDMQVLYNLYNGDIKEYKRKLTKILNNMVEGNEYHG